MANIKPKKRHMPVRAVEDWPDGLVLSGDVATTMRLFIQAYNNYTKYAEAISKPMQLSPSQGQVLLTLFYGGRAMKLTEVSPFLPFETASISLIISKLEKIKLVQRRHSKSDRRNVYISLTPEGEEIAKNLWRAVYALIIKTFQDCLTPKERKLLSAILRKMRDVNPT